MSNQYESIIGRASSAVSNQSLSLVSPRSIFLMYFFGGPIAGYLFMRSNSMQLPSHKKERLLFNIITVIFLAVVAFSIQAQAGASAPDMYRLLDRNWARVFGVGMYLTHYFAFAHSAYRHYELKGGEYRSPWGDAIKCLVVGTGLLFGFALVVLTFAGASK